MIAVESSKLFNGENTGIISNVYLDEEEINEIRVMCHD